MSFAIAAKLDPKPEPEPVAKQAVASAKRGAKGHGVSGQPATKSPYAQATKSPYAQHMGNAQRPGAYARGGRPGKLQKQATRSLGAVGQAKAIRAPKYSARKDSPRSGGARTAAVAPCDATSPRGARTRVGELSGAAPAPAEAPPAEAPA